MVNIMVYTVMAMAISCNYFWGGTIHSINGVLLVLLTGKGP